MNNGIINILIQSLFRSFQINSCDELLLGGNEKLSNIVRLKWRTIPTTEPASKGNMMFNIISCKRMETS